MRIDGETAKKVLASVADAETWAILGALLRSPKDAAAIGKELELPASTVYRKLASAREAGLVMVDEFVIKPGGKRNAIFTTTFEEIRFVAERDGLQIDLIENQKSIERRWLKLFYLRESMPSPLPLDAFGS